jgi:peptidoglycan/LPS O-acetylase OafA/YrhL
VWIVAPVAHDNSGMLIRNIQALRAIAANGVVITHLVSVEQKYSPGGGVLSANAYLGGFGVDLFFVVSGFIMVTIAHNASWRKFLFDRATRILPPYWFYTTILLIASLYIRGHVSGSSEHEPSVWRSYLLIPDSIPPMPLLGVGWTLMHEMYFYFSFAIIIFLSESRRFTITSLLLAWSCAIICFNAAVQLFDISDPVVAVIAHPFTLEFIFGAAAALLIQKNGPSFAAYTLAAGIILCVAVFSLCSDALGSNDDRNWKRAILFGMPRAILVGTPCTLIVYGLVGIEIKSKLAAPHWLVVLGSASYSTYLSHILVLSVLGRMSVLMPSRNFYFETAFVIICVITANIVGFLSYTLIERRPRSRALDAKTERRLVPFRSKPPLPR